jgi:ferredoxin
MIVYFTGTGNSRFVAEKLAEKTGDALTDAASYIREGKRAEFTEPGTYVFIAPVYVSAPALPFLDFIRASGFPDNVRAYFIMCCTSYMGASPAYCQKIAREKGFSYLGTAMVCMPQNYLLYFRTYGDDVNLEKVREALPAIEKLAELIRAGRELPVTEPSHWDLFSTKMVLKPYYKFFMKADAFHATDACIGCGSCARICPLGNITLKEGRPVWGKKCIHCVGCINLCPKQAIEFGKRTVGKLRYPGPERLYAQLKDESIR